MGATTFWKAIVNRPNKYGLSVVTQVEGELADALRASHGKEGTVLLHEEGAPIGTKEAPDVEWATLLTIGGHTVGCTSGGNVDWRDPEEPLRTQWLETLT